MNDTQITDLPSRDQDFPELSQEIKSLLDQRRQQVREGNAQLLHWETVKNQIGRQTTNLDT